MDPVIVIFVFVFGTIIGSFLNAVLWRLRTGETFVRGRSYCPRCQHELSAWDLVPVASFVALKGRCRYCREPISPSYLVIELVTGALFLLFAWPHIAGGGQIVARDLARMLLSWYFAAVLLIVFVFDLRYMLILRTVTLPAALIAFAGNIALGAQPFTMLIGVAVGGGIFWLQHRLSSGRWIGGGDIHLGLLMGAMLGWPHILLALFLAYVCGAAVATVMLLMRTKTWKSQIPFGTFLSAATIVALLWGEPMLAWYLRAAGLGGLGL